MSDPDAAASAGPIPADSLVGKLKTECAQDWRSYAEHAFVRKLATGTLPEASFRHYLIQDYLFLIHFARAYALAAYKSDTLADMRESASALHALLDTEMRLHVDYCARWGLDEDEITGTPEARANLTYTRFVLETGHAGDLLDLLVALAPCACGYGEIGGRLMSDPDTKLEDNPYREWIELYGGEEFQNVSRNAVAQIDRVAARRIGQRPEDSGRWPSLVHVFRTATQLEADFWQMGLERTS
jgi:thiaminase/transcriptional activator TenA